MKNRYLHIIKAGSYHKWEGSTVELLVQLATFWVWLELQEEEEEEAPPATLATPLTELVAEDVIAVGAEAAPIVEFAVVDNDDDEVDAVVEFGGCFWFGSKG